MTSYGTRGEIEPCVAIGRELLRRGHEVQMAVACDLTGFVEAAGITPIGYELDSQSIAQFYLEMWERYFFTRNIWKIQSLGRVRTKHLEICLQAIAETRRTLKSVADGAHLLLTGLCFEPPAATVAEYHGIPLVSIHNAPIRVNGSFIPGLSSSLVRSAMTAYEWLGWWTGRRAEDDVRSELGLPKTEGPYTRQIEERGWLEIQAYDQICYPGLAAEWTRLRAQRPFVGSLTMELPTGNDAEVLAWIAEGTPPICFSFGSMPVRAASDAITMISAACAELDERALICAGVSEFSRNSPAAHVKLVNGASYAAVFPLCRAVVHHGSTGTSGASLRAGVPTLILWFIRDQAILGASVKRLKVGTARRFSATTRDSLVSDLRTILAPQYATRAREIADQMTNPADGTSFAADLVENLAEERRRR